jgi:hypothetical protein
MFLGHFSLALASKQPVPRVSLGWLFTACQFPDLLWPPLVLAGVERVSVDPSNTAFTPLAFDYYPWSHSLLMDVVWGAALGALYFALRRHRPGALAVSALVVSHWLLDWITHRPDLPLAPGSATVAGLGLWNSVPATIVVEAAMYAGAVWLYARTTSAIDRVGGAGFWALAAFLVVIYVANIVGPLPTSANMVAASALGLWILIPIAAWVDRHRVLRVRTA